MMSRHRWVLPLIVAAMATGGCGRNATSTAPGASSQPANAQTASRKHIDLVGIWLGRGSLDRDKLQKALTSIENVEERARLEAMAKSFESVAIGMEFRPDATMALEVEIIPPDSEPVRENSAGFWRVVASDNGSITVRYTEDLGNGETDQQTVRYDYSADRNALTTVAPANPELLSFAPRFRFERRIEADIARQPDDQQPVMR
jgi:hypothetical protein